MTESKKLTSGHKRVLTLIQSGAWASIDGWATVSSAVAPIFTDPNFKGGVLPPELFEFEKDDATGGGRVRLTEKGRAVLDAMAYLD